MPCRRSGFSRTATALAAALADKAPVPMALAKRLLDQARHLDVESALALEADALLACMGSSDWQEGLRAFREKRAPRLVVPMLPAPVAELIVGVRRDPSFGPILLVGAGGVAAELHEDAAVRSLPVDRQEIREMVCEIRLARGMEGFRGRPPVHWDSLVDLGARLAACAAAYPGIVELEANPVFAYHDRAVAVDVRAFLDSREAGR